MAATRPELSALAIVAALRCLSAHAGDVLKATGHAQLLVRLSVVKALLIVPSLIIGARYGAIGVAFGLVVATAIGTMITLVFASRIIGVSLREIAASFYPSIAAVSSCRSTSVGTRWSVTSSHSTGCRRSRVGAPGLGWPCRCSIRLAASSQNTSRHRRADRVSRCDS